MDVRELTFRGDDKTALYACGACGHLFSPAIYACKNDAAHKAAKGAAENCCAPKYCDCGAPVEKFWTACEPCRTRNRLTRATVVTDYTGPVFSDGVDGDWGEGYSSEVGALMEFCADEELQIPAYCFPCHPTPLRLDVGSILEGALDGQHEDAGDQVVGAKALAAAVDAFNEAQTCVSYHPDYNRVIILDPVQFAALIAGPQVQP